MTLTAGTPGAVTAVLPTVAQHIDGDRLTVTLDLSDQDILVLLARALRRVGLMRTFATLGTAEGLVGQQLKALRSEPAVRDALTITLDEARAVDLSTALEEATLARLCDFCHDRYAVADDLCDRCLPEGDR